MSQHLPTDQEIAQAWAAVQQDAIRLRTFRKLLIGALGKVVQPVKEPQA